MTFRTFAATAAVISIAANAAQAQDRPRPDDHPPWKALTSSSAALKVVFDEVCLSAALNDRSVEALAIERHLVEVKPKLAGFSGDVRTWRLASLSPVYVVAWADGTCSATVERGDPEAFRQQVLETLAAHDIKVTRGQSQAALGDGVNVPYCTSPPQPLVVSIITPTTKKSRRPAILLNVFKAKGELPSFCRPDASVSRNLAE
jgi:hypothetical protein